MAQAAVNAGKGVTMRLVVNVGGHSMVVRDIIIDDTFRIGTAYIKGG